MNKAAFLLLTQFILFVLLWIYLKALRIEHNNINKAVPP